MNAKQDGLYNASLKREKRSNSISSIWKKRSNSIFSIWKKRSNSTYSIWKKRSNSTSSMCEKRLNGTFQNQGINLKKSSPKQANHMNTSNPFVLFGRFFATDIRRIFTEATFWVSIFIGFLTLVIPFVLFSVNSETDSISGGFVTAQSTVFPFVAPFLAALPFAGMYKNEVETKYADLLMLRRGGRSYAFTRFITVGISGGLALILPQILLLLFTFVSNYTDSISDYKRIITVMILAFPFGFTFAVAAQAVTAFTRSKALAVITPEVLYLLFTYSFPYLELDEYYPPLAVSPFIYGVPDYKHILSLFAIIILFSLIVTIIDKEKST
jgi:ABC-type transport system involved in multi-copper enzyme maturation permease subunit